jgi:hypothetical protein
VRGKVEGVIPGRGMPGMSKNAELGRCIKEAWREN